jgi:hypothetical protein
VYTRRAVGTRGGLWGHEAWLLFLITQPHAQVPPSLIKKWSMWLPSNRSRAFLSPPPSQYRVYLCLGSILTADCPSRTKDDFCPEHGEAHALLKAPQVLLPALLWEFCPGLPPVLPTGPPPPPWRETLTAGRMMRGHPVATLSSQQETEAP